TPLVDLRPVRTASMSVPPFPALALPGRTPQALGQSPGRLGSIFGQMKLDTGAALPALPASARERRGMRPGRRRCERRDGIGDRNTGLLELLANRIERQEALLH